MDIDADPLQCQQVLRFYGRMFQCHGQAQVIHYFELMTPFFEHDPFGVSGVSNNSESLLCLEPILRLLPYQESSFSDHRLHKVRWWRTLQSKILPPKSKKRESCEGKPHVPSTSHFPPLGGPMTISSVSSVRFPCWTFWETQPVGSEAAMVTTKCGDFNFLRVWCVIYKRDVAKGTVPACLSCFWLGFGVVYKSYPWNVPTKQGKIT